MIFELTESPFIDSLLDFDYDGNNLDLHNDVDIDVIEFGEKCLTVVLSNQEIKASLVFENCEIISFVIIGTEDTLNNFYKGRYEYGSKLYDTYEGKVCFYIDLESGSEICLLTERAYLKIDRPGTE